MIFHINLFDVKPGVCDEQREAGLDLMRQDAANPAVKSWIVGRVLGGEYEYSAVYVVEDLDGYWARHLQERPELAALMAQAATFPVPEGAGHPSAAHGQAKA